MAGYIGAFWPPEAVFSMALLELLESLASRLLRRLGLLQAADWFRYLVLWAYYRQRHRAFCQAHPDFPLPPGYLMYESFGLNVRAYAEGGRQTASWLLDLVAPHLQEKKMRVLDWGCGPGRVVRHFESLTAGRTTLFASDVNTRSLNWCRENIRGVTFLNQGLLPPLGLEAKSLDLIYGISILTHLSLEAQERWLGELGRLLRHGGILLLTTQGESFRSKLSQAEIACFEKGNPVVRGSVKEGHRTWSCFHPATAVPKLLSGFIVLRHLPGQGKAQDVWIAERKAK